MCKKESKMDLKVLNIHPVMRKVIQLLSEDKDMNMNEALSIIEAVVSEYDVTQYPNYSTGLAGIGCGIQYLIRSGLIDAKADEVLVELDQHLFLAVCFRKHTDLSHATGLMGIASYFFGRLEDIDANDDNLCTITAKSVLLSILDILLARFGIEGYSSQKTKEPLCLTNEEKEDVRQFVLRFMQYGICNSMGNKLLRNISSSDKFVAGDIREEIFQMNMDDVTVVIPTRIDSNERYRNLQTIIRFYSSFTNMHFIVLEADHAQAVYFDEESRVEYLYYKDENPVFHHTHYRNEMIKLAKTPIVIVWDIDILVPQKQLYSAVSDVRTHRAVLSYPYDGICYSLPPDLSENFRCTLDWNLLFSKDGNLPSMFGELTVGGIFVVNRESYMQVGMENEYFVGWGPEDIERLKRLTILDIPVSRVDGCIYHLYHPRKLNSGYVDKYQNLMVKKELLRICRMNKVELLQEVTHWKWIN